jgi:hypothetical protein
MCAVNPPSMIERLAGTRARVRRMRALAFTVAPVSMGLLLLLAAVPSRAVGGAAGVTVVLAAAGDTPAPAGKPRPADFTAVDVTPEGREPSGVLPPVPAARPTTQSTTRPTTGPSGDPTADGRPQGSSDLSGLFSENLLSRTSPEAMPTGHDGAGSGGTAGAKATSALPGRPVAGLGLSPLEIGLAAVALAGMIGAAVYAWRRRA